jgi:hypothetical protein
MINGKTMGIFGGVFLLTVLCAGIVGFYVEIRSRLQLVPACGGVSDKTIPSPNKNHRAHIMNQYCAPGVGISSDPYWVVVGDNVARAGQVESVDLAQEGEVAFKTWDYEPTVSWKDDDHLIIQIEHVASIAKSLHIVGDIHVSYKIAENLSEKNFRRDQSNYENNWLAIINSRVPTGGGSKERDIAALKARLDRSLRDYKAFQGWAESNAE